MYIMRILYITQKVPECNFASVLYRSSKKCHIIINLKVY